MSKKSASFRVGKVLAYLRNKVWYLCHHENGRRHRPRVGPNLGWQVKTRNVRDVPLLPVLAEFPARTPTRWRTRAASCCPSGRKG